MNFERNSNPKESMGIGLEAESVSVAKIRGQIYLKWTSKRYHRTEDFEIRKRWFVPKKALLKLLGKKNISGLYLSLLCKAKVEGGDIEKLFKVVFPWVFICSKIRKIKSQRPSATIHLVSSWKIDQESYRDNRAQVAFSITSYDLDKIESIRKKSQDASIKGAIHKGKVYPIKHGNKDLV